MAIRERWAAVLAGLSLVLLPAALPGGTPGGPSLLPPAQAEQPQGQAKPVLRIGAIPDQKPEKLNRLYP